MFPFVKDWFTFKIEVINEAFHFESDKIFFLQIVVNVEAAFFIYLFVVLFVLPGFKEQA